MGKSKTTILIADDHPIFRAGLIQVISGRVDLVVTGEAGDGLELLQEVARLAPDILIVDVDMPELDGIGAVRVLRKHGCGSEVIFLTMHKTRSILRAMTTLNVRGYVLKDSAMKEIVECIDTVRRGDTYVSHVLDGLLLSEAGHRSSELGSQLLHLSPAEQRILARIAESRSTREIADELFISVRTVETHRYNICSKLGVRGSHALLKFALSNRNRILTVLSD